MKRQISLPASAYHHVQVLSPELCAVVSHPSTPVTLAATCFSIMAELAGALASLSGKYQRQVGP